jgi:hypothetical protein
MQVQNYGNHRRFVVMYHAVLMLLIVVTLIGSCVNLVKSLSDHARLYSASLLVAVNIALLLMFFFVRMFPLKAQDRAIRAEENLRHFAMTGKLLDPKLTIRQIIGLRFASDEEYLALAKKAVDENLSEDDIKKAVKNWRSDFYRA